MQITMIGIDHNKASIAYRELFSFTKAGAMEAMKKIKEEFHVAGCLLLSTCNRTELWISDQAKPICSPYDMLCHIKEIDRNQYGDFFVEREGASAVDHLLRLSCGLDSKIFGEDQIISQVREAMALSRKCHCADMVLEKLFQTAIAAGKKVKSKVRITAVDQSTAHDAVTRLQREMGSLKGISCLVIGNGQMGKLIASALVAQGALVTMTLRKKMHHSVITDSIVPTGCTMMPYEQRYEALVKNQVVISATLSPHFTLLKQDVERAFAAEEKIEEERKRIWLDLAVPRDMDPTLNGFAGLTIYDIDTVSPTDGGVGNDESVAQALCILDHYAKEMERWFAFRSRVPQVQEITKLVAEDTEKRLENALHQWTLEEREEEELEQVIQDATERAVGKILFGLRETLPEHLWDHCLQGIWEAAKRDTIKTGIGKWQ